MSEDERETLDETAKRMVREENERTRNEEKEPAGESMRIEGGAVKIDEDDPIQLKQRAPGKLKEKATSEIVALCSDLVRRGWVTEWDIRNILCDLAPKYSVTKYHPGHGKGP